MTRYEICQLAADLIGRTDLIGAQGEIGGAPNAAEKRQIIVAINAAFQEMRGYAPRNFFKRTYGAEIRPAVAATIDITASSTVCEIQSPTWEPWMEGCTIIIDGDERPNRLWNDKQLAFPYLGTVTTNPAKATIYNDCVPLSDELIEVNAGVWWDAKYRLKAVANEVVPLFRGDFWNRNDDDYGFLNNDNYSYRCQQCDTPRFYFIDSEHQDATGSEHYMRFRSYPSEAGRVEFTGAVRPGRWTVSSFVNSGEGLDTVAVPGDHIESILIPFINQNLTKMFKFEVIATANTSQSENILTQHYQDYEEAITLLEDLNTGGEGNISIDLDWG